MTLADPGLRHGTLAGRRVLLRGYVVMDGRGERELCGAGLLVAAVARLATSRCRHHALSSCLLADDPATGIFGMGACGAARRVSACGWGRGWGARLRVVIRAGAPDGVHVPRFLCRRAAAATLAAGPRCPPLLLPAAPAIADFYVVLGRRGNRVARRKHATGRVGRSHRMDREQAIKYFQSTWEGICTR